MTRISKFTTAITAKTTRVRNAKREPWEHPEDTLWCLCDSCHERAESARAAIYYEIAKIHPMHHWEVRRMLKEVQELIEKNADGLKESAVDAS